MEIGDSINHKDPDIITPNFDLAKTSRWCAASFRVTLKIILFFNSVTLIPGPGLSKLTSR